MPFCSCVLELIRSSMLPITPHWGHEKGREKSLDSKKIKARTWKEDNSWFLEETKKTLTDSGKGSCLLIPMLLPHLFLLVFPISHERWRLLQLDPCWSSTRRTWLLHCYCLETPAKIPWALGMPWFHWLAAYSIDLHPSKGVACLQLFKWW